MGLSGAPNRIYLARIHARGYLTQSCKYVTCTCVLDPQADESAPKVSQHHPGTVTVGAPGMETEQVLSVQVRGFTPEEIDAAEAKMVKQAGPVIARLRQRTEAIWELILAELNGKAGGQSSARTTVLAHHALRAHTALELQTMLAEVSAGQDRDGSDRAFRSLAGLAVVATDLLNKAYAAATEEGAAKAKAQSGGPVGELMGRLGVTASGHEPPLGGTATGGETPGVGAEVPTDSPFVPPGPSHLGPPAPKPATSPLNSPKKGKR